MVVHRRSGAPYFVTDGRAHVACTRRTTTGQEQDLAVFALGDCTTVPTDRATTHKVAEKGFGRATARHDRVGSSRSAATVVTRPRGADRLSPHLDEPDEERLRYRLVQRDPDGAFAGDVLLRHPRHRETVDRGVLDPGAEVHDGHSVEAVRRQAVADGLRRP